MNMYTNTHIQLGHREVSVQTMDLSVCSVMQQGQIRNHMVDKVKHTLILYI